MKEVENNSHNPLVMKRISQRLLKENQQIYHSVVGLANSQPVIDERPVVHEQQQTLPFLIKNIIELNEIVEQLESKVKEQKDEYDINYTP